MSTTTTTTTTIIIRIEEHIIPDGSGNRQYSIVGGSSCEFSSFSWWHSGSTGVYSLGQNNISNLVKPLDTDKIWVNVIKYTETYWNGGEFYGGNFYGNFGGGTFHYGQLNDCFYLKQEIKPRPFIEDINKPTGPQSVKPINTSRLL